MPTKKLVLWCDTMYYRNKQKHYVYYVLTQILMLDTMNLVFRAQHTQKTFMANLKVECAELY